jgi:hypothetical protein
MSGKTIGKSLRQRHVLDPLPAERAVAMLTDLLPAHAARLVQVRAQDARMIACLVVQADEASVRLCRRLGFDWKRGGTGVFGLLGPDAARLFTDLPAPQRAWLEAPCGPRETKVFLIAGGTALLTLDVTDGKVAITAVP